MTPDIGRREFIAALGAMVVLALPARAQQTSRLRRVGALMSISDDEEGQVRIAAFQKRLAELGWVSGNLRIDYRWSEGDADRMRAYAAELVKLNPDAILVQGTAALRAMHQATPATPVVFVAVSDPVPEFIPNLAHPGGNTTGITNIEPSMGGKWVELLKEIAPQLSNVVLLFNPATTNGVYFGQAVQAAAAIHGIKSREVAVRDAGELARAIEEVGRGGSGLIVPPDPLTITQRELIVAAVARLRIPAIYPYRLFAMSGGLVSYGWEPTEGFVAAAGYIDRILRGEKPGDLPVQRPSKFEMVINLKTARALGLDVSPMIIALADEVIE
jgi:putative tryptophan/tyrosine transport system substrate-binding protein